MAERFERHIARSGQGMRSHDARSSPAVPCAPPELIAEVLHPRRDNAAHLPHVAPAARVLPVPARPTIRFRSRWQTHDRIYRDSQHATVQMPCLRGACSAATMGVRARRTTCLLIPRRTCRRYHAKLDPLVVRSTRRRCFAPELQAAAVAVALQCGDDVQVVPPEVALQRQHLGLRRTIRPVEARVVGVIVVPACHMCLASQLS